MNPAAAVPPKLECLLLADDLTGACDAAVHFALRGRRTAAGVSLRSAPHDAQVWAVNADSRDLDPEALGARIAEASKGLPIGPETLIFKKIDSTLRGNAGMEAMAALQAFGCELAVFTPALPAMGRMVEGGWLRVAGSTGFAPVELADWLRAQGVKECAHARAGAVADAVASGAKLVSLDAICDRDLDRAVAEVRALERRILWVGSAGLAAALARALPAVQRVRGAAPQSRGPVLFGIGSTHAATVAQMEALAASRPVVRIACTESSAQPVALALHGGSHVWLELPHGQVPEATVGKALAGARAAALVLSGGDTASLVCRALGVERIELEDEILPGIPRGRLGGGGMQGMAVVTKSGGFGAPDALIQVADYFRCPKS